jgi:hypothetical protein
MKNKVKKLQILFVCLLIFSNCGGRLPPPPHVSGGIDLGVNVGPVEVILNIDNEGNVSVTTGIAHKLDFKLGAVGFSVGLSQTVDFCKHKPYHLFILWEDSNGDIHRTEYEIGKKFQVKFNHKEWVREIIGENDSIIIVVEHPSQEEDDTVTSYPESEEVDNSDSYTEPDVEEELDTNTEESEDEEYREIVECVHKLHEYDYADCQHPKHFIGDLYACTHSCFDYYGSPILCHPQGDLFPCSHPLHVFGDIVPCTHLLHPDGDTVWKN